jgi:hypothetical protein
MILRRLAVNFKEQNWFAVAVAIELVVVVAGVFIGIEVSNWNAGRLQHDAARTYVIRLREDLAENIADLQTRKAYYRQVRSHGLAALAAMDRPPASLGPQFLIDAYEGSQIITRIVGKNTYDEILSVGAINSFADVSVRKQLAFYFLSLRNSEIALSYIPPYRETLRRHMPYGVQHAITTQCPEKVMVIGDDSFGAKLAERCTIDLPVASVATAVAEVDIPEVRLDLNRCLADLDLKMLMFDRVIARAKALDAFLAQHNS